MIISEDKNLEDFSDFNKLNYHVLDSMVDWVRIVDLEGRTLYANKQMLNDLGRDFVGEICYEAFGRENSCDYCSSNSSIISETPVEKEELVGNNRYSVKSSPIRNFEGKIIGVVEVLRDVTRERKLENELINKNDKMKKDLDFAKKIQKGILPNKGVCRELILDYVYKSSETLSGDIFDMFIIDKNKIGIYIADVSGHGVSASIMTMFIKQSMLSVKNYVPGPRNSLNEMNRRFSELKIDPENYFTMFYGIINTTENSMRYSNAGHSCTPIIKGGEETKFLELSGPPIIRGANKLDTVISRKEEEVEFNKGERLILYTDGLIENRGADGEMIDESIVIDYILNTNNLAEVVEKVEAISKESLQKDDVTLISIEHL